MTVTCRLCQGDELRRRLSFPSFSLWQCRLCGFEQIDPKPTIDQLRQIYSAAYFGKAKYDDARALAREYRRRRALMRRTGIRPGMRLLEIGCGVADFLEPLAAEHDVAGIDISTAAIDQAKTRCPHLADRLEATPIEAFEPAGDGYDAVLMWDVIEHLWNGPSMLATIAHWLRPGGRLVLSTPDVRAVTARLMGRKWPFMTPPEHLCFFGAKSVRLAGEQAGLKTLSTESKGKWANVAFVLYKAGRVGLLPSALVDRVNRLGLDRLSIYVPTGDVLYAALEKPAVPG
jgi:SAM-dependent methyltransferase